MANKKKSKKKSTVRHTRAIHRDRSKRPIVGPPDEQIESRLKELLEPATKAQESYCKEFGLRSRVLTLPLMVEAI